MIPKITDHVDQALAKLSTRYKPWPIFRAWVASHVKPLQDLEDAAHPIGSAFDLDTADLARLQVLAKIVGQSVLSDAEQLRAAIRVRILVNRSNGRLPEIARICALLFGQTEIRELSPPRLLIYPADPVSAPAVLQASLLRESKAGGVGLTLITGDVDTDLTYADGAGDDSDDHGFGDGLDLDSPPGGFAGDTL